MAGFSFGGKKGSGWSEARRRLTRGAASLKKTEAMAVRSVALLVEREIKKGIRSGAPGGQRFKPLSPITKLLRRGRRPLIDNGAAGGLLGSIKTTFNAKTAQAFVGVHRTARSSSGESLVNIAVVHEFGTKPFAIPVTDGVRRFFIMLHLKSNGKILPIGANKTVIMHPGVPARPFIRPTVEKLRPRLQKLIAKVVSDRGVV